MTDIYEIEEQLEDSEPVIVNEQGELEVPEEANADQGTQVKESRWFVDQLMPNTSNTAPAGTTVKSTIWSSGWWQDNPGRLVKEKRVMRQRFPDFEIRELDDNLAWKGTLTSNNYNDYEVAIKYPPRYPNPSKAPKAFIVDPRIEHTDTKHMWPDGHLCLFKPSDRDNRSWEKKSTAATVVSWTAAWIFAYERYQETGNWPGPEAH